MRPRRRKRGRRPAGTGYVFQSRSGWVYRFFDHAGHRRQGSGYMTRELVEEALRQAKTKSQEERVLGRKHVEARFFKDVAEEYLGVAANRLRPSTLEGARYWITGSLIPSFGSTRIDEIERRDIEKFLSGMTARGCQASTRNRGLSALSGVFRHAEVMEYILPERNPVHGIKRPREAVRPPVYFSPEEQERLLGACPGILKPMVALGMDCGLRQGEILDLAWPHVDFERAVVTVAESKSHRPRIIPASARLLGILLERAAGRGPVPIDAPDYVFPMRQWRGELTAAWKAALRVAGLPDVPFHSLRSVFACTASASGLSVPEMMMLLGHQSAAMSVRYAGAMAPGLIERTRERMETWRQMGTEKARKTV